MKGEDLKTARELAGLTQQQVADKLGRDRVTVARWEARPDEIKPTKARRFLEAVRQLCEAA